MAIEGVLGTRDGFGDADVCSARLGARRDWSDGTYTVTCESCGTSFREATDLSSGETIVLCRAGGRWMEWAGASSLAALIDGRIPHPRSGGRTFARGIH